MSRLVSWNSHVSSRGPYPRLGNSHVSSRGIATSRLVENIFSTENTGIIHAKYRVMPRVQTRVEMKL